MNLQVSEAIWLNESEFCSIDQLIQLSGLSAEEVQDLVDSGVIDPVGDTRAPQRFSLQCVVTVKTARRLRDDFELDQRGVALAVKLLQQIEEMQAELNSLRLKRL